MEWKLTRGKMRPNLLKYSKEADPAAVEAASTAAFQHLAEFTGSHTPSLVKSVRAALDELTVIKVGWPLGSGMSPCWHCGCSVRTPVRACRFCLAVPPNVAGIAARIRHHSTNTLPVGPCRVWDPPQLPAC